MHFISRPHQVLFFALMFILAAAGVQAQRDVKREAEVTVAAGVWTVTVNGTVVHVGPDMIEAVQAAANNLSPNRTWKENIHVRGSGSTGSHDWDGDIRAINIPGQTILDFHGNTIHVNDDVDNTIVPVRGIRANNIEIRNLRITGNPRYGIWLFGCENVVISQVHLSIAGTLSANGPGLGVRIQERSSTWSRNVSIDHIYVENSKGHAVEIWHTDGLTIGTVETRATGGCGLLLNATTNASVGLVNSYRANRGGGYAAFRTANNAGPNIVVDKVISRESGRGVFTVSGSHGVTVHEVDIAGSTSHGILIEDTQNTEVNGGTIVNCGAEGVRVTSRSSEEHHPTRNVTVRNLTVSGCSYGIRETLPRTADNRIFNNQLAGNGTCLVVQGTGTVAAGNSCSADGRRINDLYVAWLDRTFPELTVETSDPGSDPYGEGIPKLLRYALELNSPGGRSSLPLPAHDGDRLSFRFRRDPVKNDIAYRVEASFDAIDWREAIYDSRVDQGPNNEGDFMEIIDPVPMSETGGRRFLRLRIVFID